MMKIPVDKKIKNDDFRYEIELVFGNLRLEELTEVTQLIPLNYKIEDRSKNGWGFVLIVEHEFTNTLNQSVEEFLNPLDGMEKIIYQHNCLMRIAVYYPTITCTLKFDLKEKLMKFNLSLEITTYPTKTL